ncbi:YbhB/YbcL family Raf kinase inhibitor-like protein [Candidatus Pyrohabitans sp.]
MRLRSFIPGLLLLALLMTLPGCTREEARETAPALEVKLEFSQFPARYTCDGEDISPKIEICKLREARSIAVILDDPDAPLGTFTHWLIWNIEPVGVIPESVPREGVVSRPIGAVQGKNDFGKVGYGGPCPPKGKPHRYFFRVYALDTRLELEPGSGRRELERAMEGHVLQYGEAMATYAR